MSFWNSYKKSCLEYQRLLVYWYAGMHTGSGSYWFAVSRTRFHGSRFSSRVSCLRPWIEILVFISEIAKLEHLRISADFQRNVAPEPCRRPRSRFHRNGSVKISIKDGSKVAGILCDWPFRKKALEFPRRSGFMRLQIVRFLIIMILGGAMFESYIFFYT